MACGLRVRTDYSSRQLRQPRGRITAHEKCALTVRNDEGSTPPNDGTSLSSLLAATVTGGHQVERKPGAREIGIALVSAAAGAIATLVSQEAAAGEDIERGAAEDFMDQLYDTVVDDPRLVWDTMLSDGLRSRHEGYEEFEANWAQWSEVERQRVSEKPDSQNWFLISVAYVDQDGREQSYRPIEFQLPCVNPLANRLVVLNCDQDDLRLHDAYNTSGGLAGG